MTAAHCQGDALVSRCGSNQPTCTCNSREELQNAVAQGIECLIEDAKAAGLPPVFAAYTALIRAWGQRKQMVNVRQVLTDMREDGLQPNELHYRAAILAHARNFRPHEAEVFDPHVSLAHCLGGTHMPAAYSGVRPFNSGLTYAVKPPRTIRFILHMTCDL